MNGRAVWIGSVDSGISGLKNVSYQPGCRSTCWHLQTKPVAVWAGRSYSGRRSPSRPLLALKCPLALCRGFHLPHGLACWCGSRGCRSPCHLNGGHHDGASGSQFGCLLTLNSSTCGTFWVLSLPQEGLRRAQEVKTATPHAHPPPSAPC